jgi:aminodeoxyfutalosine synthase
MTDATWLERMGDKLQDGVSLSDAEIATLSETRDLVRLGALADARRRKLRGDRATFVRVVEVAASGAAGEDGPRRAGEFRLAGPPASTAQVVESVRAVVLAAGGVPVSGFALDELVDLCGGDAARFEDLLATLRSEGLAHIAEARVERTADPAWVTRASAAGVPVARWTVCEQGADGIDALLRVARWGRDAAVPAFAPLSAGVSEKPSTGYEDVRRVALARLLVDNIQSIQVDWRRYGPQLAQVALTFGADDLDGVSPDDAEEQGPRRATLEEITRNIRAAGLVPVERDGRFRTLCTYHP